MLTRRHLIALSAAQTFVPNLFIREGRGQATQVDFANKPGRIIVAVPPGGPTDIVARMLADKLSKLWDQQVFIENKGGAGTNIGNEYAARSDPDGYTILFATASLGVNTSLSPALTRCRTLSPACMLPSLSICCSDRPPRRPTRLRSSSTMPNPTPASSRWH